MNDERPAECDLQPGLFVSLLRLEFEGQYGQIVAVNQKTGSHLVKFFARIDYTNLDKLFHENKRVSQRLVNMIMPRDYRAPCSPFNVQFFTSRNVPLASSNVDVCDMAVEMTVWDDNCFFGPYCYKTFDQDELKLATKIPEGVCEQFAKNVACFEKGIDHFIENMNKIVAGRSQQQDRYHPLSGPFSQSLDKVWPALPRLTSLPKTPTELMLLCDPEEMRQVMQEKLNDKDWVNDGRAASTWEIFQSERSLLTWKGKPSAVGIRNIQMTFRRIFFHVCCTAWSQRAWRQARVPILRQSEKY